MCTNHLEKMICLEDSTRVLKKHQLREMFLAKKAEAEQANQLPDNDDMLRVTGLTLEDFGTIEGAIQAYEMGMNFLFQKGDLFAKRCQLFQNLNLKSVQ